MVQGSWDADTSAGFRQRLGRTAQELGLSSSSSSCPDIWELDNGHFVIVGRDVTAAYSGRLPEGVSLAAGERLVVLPRAMVLAAKPDIPDA
jgi:hypothetical protein